MVNHVMEAPVVGAIRLFEIRDSLPETAGKAYEVIWDHRKNVESKFTIAIPTYRRPDLLRQALRSAVDQQTSRSFDILICDNDPFSRDVDDVVREFSGHSLLLIRNRSNIGMYQNWNRCLQLCRTEWITILNDDDLLAPRFVDTVTPHLVAGVSLIGVGKPTITTGEVAIQMPTGINVVVKRAKSLIRSLMVSDLVVPKGLFLGNMLGNSTGCAFNRTLAIRLGGFDPQYFPSSDYLMWVRLAMVGRAKRLKQLGAYYRIGQNESFKLETLQGMLKCDYELRCEIAKILDGPAWFKQYVVNRQFFCGAESLRAKWNPALNVSDLGKELGLSRPRVKVSARVLSILNVLLLSHRQYPAALLPLLAVEKR